MNRYSDRNNPRGGARNFTRFGLSIRVESSEGKRDERLRELLARHGPTCQPTLPEATPRSAAIGTRLKCDGSCVAYRRALPDLKR